MSDIQKINIELRTVAAEELQKTIASELDNMEEVDLAKLLLEEDEGKADDKPTPQ